MNLHADFQKSVDGCAAANYFNSADANSSVGFDSLNIQADSRLYFVMRFFYVRDMPCCAQIMVGRNGGAFVLAGFLDASLSTLLRLTTPFDSGLVRFAQPIQEAAHMANLSLSAPQTYVFKFAAFDRSADVFLPVTVSVIAASEREARRAFARDYMLLMTTRIPMQSCNREGLEVNHGE